MKPFISNIILEYCVMSNQTYKIIKDAVSVKNAKMLEDNEFYYVVHYDHMILKVDKTTKESLIYFPASPSSERAIDQGLDYIYGGFYCYDKDEISLKLNGLTRLELQRMFKPKRAYTMDNNERRNFKDIDLAEYEQTTLKELA